MSVSEAIPIRAVVPADDDHITAEPIPSNPVDFDAQLKAYVSLDYDMVMGSFEATPGGTWLPAPDPTEVPARRLRNAIAPLAEHAIWSRRTNEALARFGLGFAGAYIWGRAAVLGEPPASVVASAFGVWEPRLVGGIYDEAREHCGRSGLLAAREQATVESLLDLLGDVDASDVVAILRRGLGAADGSGRAIFSGLCALEWPAHPLGQVWRACDLLREYRGDGHMAVWIGAGLGPVAINLLTELWLGMPLGPYTAMRRGWSEEAILAGIRALEGRGLVADGAITAAGRSVRDEIEERTDALEQPVVDAIGDDLDALVECLDAWSGLCAQAGAFPPGTFRRGG